jgi:Ca-activated chloride channel family protein
MRSKNVSVFLCLLVTSLFSAINANAQGIVIPIICDIRPCQPRPPRPIPLPNVLPVKSINIDTKITGQVATTKIEQIFSNNTQYTLEGTYFFPIPDGAAISEFAIWENGKKLVGEVRSRDEARRIYDEIVRRQRDPGLLEYAGKDLFQASIFPIPPNSEKKLTLTYSQVLKAEGGTVSYKYPLGTGRRLWADPSVFREDGGEWTKINGPNTRIGVVSGRIEIESKQALRNIYSPSHSIDIKRTGETKAVMTFESTNKNDQNDFQLFYGLSDQDFGLSLITYREAAKDGYFLLTLSPKDTISEKELVNKDIVFVLDTSGSMADAGKMEKARSALLFGIRSLREGDRFNVINFAGEEHLMESGLIAAGPAGKSRGEEFVKKLQPTGGTNINDALQAAMKQFDSAAGAGRPKMLVFMTDGLPTVGETNADKIVRNIGDKKVEGVRIFPFGVGYDVNTILLDKLASDNGGTADYVEPREDIEVKVSNFFAKVSSPVLTDLELDFGGVQTDLIYPKKMPDLFRGMQITVIGRYQNPIDNRTIRLIGKQNGETRTYAFNDLDFPSRAEDNTFLPRLWATRRVGWLIEQIRANGEQKELRDEVIDLGTRYGIVTPYTSYLATDGSEKQFGYVAADRAPAGKPQAIVRGRNNNFQIDGADSGAGAVQTSKNVRVQQETASVDVADDEVISIGGVQKVGVKTFYNEKGFWIDGEYQESAKLPEVKLKFASEGYFDLLKQEKELAQYFALGNQVVIVWKGKVYRVEK